MSVASYIDRTMLPDREVINPLIIRRRRSPMPPLTDFQVGTIENLFSKKPNDNYKAPGGNELIIGHPAQIAYEEKKAAHKTAVKQWRESRLEGIRDLQAYFNILDIGRHAVSVPLAIILAATGNLPIAMLIAAQLMPTDILRAIDFVKARNREEAAKAKAGISRGVFNGFMIGLGVNAWQSVLDFLEGKGLWEPLKKLAEHAKNAKNGPLGWWNSLLDGVNTGINGFNEMLKVSAGGAIKEAKAAA